jgi:GntR family transcriptional regulator
MRIEVDTTSPVPPYEQIRGQIAAMAASGVLAVGSRLPTIRQLAGDLGLAPGTVARAYRELEGQGIVTSRVRTGTTIATPRRSAEADTRDRIADAARAYAVATISLGLSRDRAVAALDEQLRELAPDPR